MANRYYEDYKNSKKFGTWTEVEFESGVKALIDYYRSEYIFKPEDIEELLNANIRRDSRGWYCVGSSGPVYCAKACYGIIQVDAFVVNDVLAQC